MYLVAQTRLKGFRKRGEEFDGCCPYHEDATPSFQIYRTPDGIWLGHCQACGETANVVQLVQRTDKVSFADAMQIIKKMTENPEWEAKRKNAEAVFAQTLANPTEVISVPLAAFERYEDELQFHSIPAKEWLESRGISWATAKAAHLGYVQSPPPHIVYPAHEWFDKGWIMFPEIRDGRVVAVKYRSVMGKKSPKGDSGFAQRKDMLKNPLYGQEQISFIDDLFVTEGEPDALCLRQEGRTAISLPSAGFSPNLEQRTLIMAANRIFLAGDMDERGRVAMTRLWKELGGGEPKSKVYMLEWPKPYKDANETFLKLCNGDVEVFRELVESLKEEALAKKLPNVVDLNTTLRTAEFSSPTDNPRRLSFPWKSLDKWVSILPAEVMFLFGTETKTGKSTWLMNILVFNAIRGKKVICYSAEQSPARYAEMVAAHLTKTNRLSLSAEVRQAAARILPPEHFYVGYKPGAKFSDVLKLLADAKQVYGGDIFVVDPLHFLIRGEQNENAAFASAMRQLVDFSIKWDVIVVAVGQARKSVAGSRGKMATGQDARFSAALSEDAASTWIIHRNRANKVDDPNGQPVYEPVTQVKLEYARNADPMSGKLIFEGSTASFLEYTNQEMQ